MIEKINIENFGVYKDYNWNRCIGSDIKFSKLNLIYGRNYSGKTTLSRIFRCFENNHHHPDFEDVKFTLGTNNGELTENDVQSASSIKVRVYNTDFIKDNLSWLHKADGTISPFTILGDVNVANEKRIEEIENILGEESTNGLYKDLLSVKNSLDVAKKRTSSKKSELEQKLKAKANDKIKFDRYLFVANTNKRNYQITDINNDISKVQDALESYILDEKATETHKKLLDEVNAGVRETLNARKPNFNSYLSRTNDIITKKIKPTSALTELVNDNLLHNWVKNGLVLHEGKKDKCGFCGSSLSPDLWEKLEAHFSKESEELITQIQELTNDIKKAKDNLSTYVNLSQDFFYSKYNTPLIWGHYFN